jgi:predicted DNA-binding ArsR family transcriptional regulator
MARAMRFDYLRIVPISRGTNSSSGGLPEKWGIAYQSSPKMVQINAQRKSFIKYADLQDIVKMLNLKSDGALQDAVNEAQSLVNEPMIPAGS